ncbi:High cysteine membrane protein Group 1 [Giardia lamblia P15]|uniref:High cysteine membrane protein Group 1 n=1 Tax=Giardia intestinalis (strain P15) TaxID=658858 RepID=E1F6U1_GIAIA|nr:High cysteine membrane protein Group 1 [Giardia lamblia P15]
MLLAALAVLFSSASSSGCIDPKQNPNGEYECQHGGVCTKFETLLSSGFICDCPRGSFGRSCNFCDRSFMLINDRCVSPACVLDGVSICGGGGECLYTEDTDSWSCSCGDGFVNIAGACIASSCINPESPDLICSGNGSCRSLPGGETGEDHFCECDSLHLGDHCEACNRRTSKPVTTDGVTDCVALECFTENEELPCGGHGRCFSYPIDGTISYTCMCGIGYSLVDGTCVPSSCVFEYSNGSHVCGYDDSFKTLCVEGPQGEWSCNCPSDTTFMDGYGCVSSQCIDSSGEPPCGGVGGCYVFQVSGDTKTYKCNCPHYTAGDFCKICSPNEATMIDDVCVPNDCIYGGTSCNGHGVCHSLLVHSFCECELEFDIIDEMQHYCGIPECHDPNTKMLCSGAGVCDEQTRVCLCIDGFQYQSYGGCVPDKLINENGVCNGRGVASLKYPWDIPINERLNATNPEHWRCVCGTLYAGDTCDQCNPSTSFTPTASPPEPQPTGARAQLPTCTPRDCYNDGYELKQPADPDQSTDPTYIDQPTKLCTNPLQEDGSRLGTCETYTIGDEDLFICTSDDPNQYQQAYNSSSIYPVACTMPGQHYVRQNFMCGLLQGKTAPLEIRMVSCRTTETNGYNCTCNGEYNWVSRTINGVEHYSCMHDECLNDGATTGSSDINDYCSGLGDCILDYTGTTHICACSASAVSYQNKCVPRECVSGWNDEQTPIICSGRGTCTYWGDEGWGCQCMDIDHYTYVNGGCYPNSCIYLWQNLTDGTSYIQLCGGDSIVTGGTCVVDEADPSKSYCECNTDFVKYGQTCVHKKCTSVDYHNDFQVTTDSICSGNGYCLFHSRTNTSSCFCKKGTSYGPFCSVEPCITTIDYEFGNIWGEIYLNCGRPGAGVCNITGEAAGECLCNFDYELLPATPEYPELAKICVNTGCVDNGVYCGGDLTAVCGIAGAMPTCLCSQVFEAVNNTCVPKMCYAPNPDGTVAVCGGVGTCEKNSGSNTYSCKCSTSGYTAAQMKYNGNTVWTCAPQACVDGTGSSATVCGGTTGGFCVGSGGQYRCSCNDGFSLVTPTQCVSNNCLSQNAQGQISICSGVGTCSEDVMGASIEYYCINCAEGFRVVDGKCVSESCYFQIGSVNKYYVCGKMGNFGECVGTGSGFACSCSYGFFLAEKYCVPNQCTDNHRHPAECGGHGECKLKNMAEFTCVCNANYETIDTDELGLHYCVAQACMVKNGEAVKSICNGHGLCRKDKCLCYEGYADETSASSNDPTGNCTVCAAGYKEYPAPSTPTAIATNAKCVKNNCGQSTQSDDCGGSTVANSPSCVYSSGTSTYECSCKTGYYANNGICEASSCVGDGSTEECGGPQFGACDNINKICTCASGMILVKPYLCVSPRCISDIATNEVCNGHGTCIINPRMRAAACNCTDSYVTARDGLCYLNTCFNDPEHAQPVVCDGTENSCSTGGVCSCTPPFVKLNGQNGCVHSDCIQNGAVCGGRGVCRANLLYTQYSCFCNDEYILASDGTCQPASCSRDGITICDGNGTCEADESNSTYSCKCNSASIPYMNGCVPRACFPQNNPRGSICGGHGLCDMSSGVCQCDSGTSLTDELLCQPDACVNPQHSATVCTSNGVCSSVSNACLCAEGSSGRYCESCAHGYRKHVENDEYNGKCVKDSCGNKDCGIPGKCVFDSHIVEYHCLCNEGFYYSTSEHECRRCLVDNCVTCNGESSCGVCEDGYYPGRGHCKECNDDCRTCSGPEETQCLSCNPGKVHSKGIGPASCIDECKENEDGCATCGSMIAGSKYCSVCRGQTSFPLEGVCQAKNSRTAGDVCENVVAGRCTRCLGDYFLYKGGCYSSSRLPGNQVCSVAFDGNCLECADGYYKTGSSIEQACISCDGIMDGCTKCTASGCTECKAGYYPDASSGRCIQCASSCKTCNGAGSRCTSCAEGYFAQFLADGLSNYGECRSCSNTTADSGLIGVKNCKQCVVFAIGSHSQPETVHCSEFFSTRSSAGVIAGSVIAVLLVLAGVIGFCVWWFLIRGKKGRATRGGQRGKSYSSRKYARVASDPDSTSLLSTDMTNSLL